MIVFFTQEYDCDDCQQIIFLSKMVMHTKEE